MIVLLEGNPAENWRRAAHAIPAAEPDRPGQVIFFVFIAIWATVFGGMAMAILPLFGTRIRRTVTAGLA